MRFLRWRQCSNRTLASGTRVLKVGINNSEARKVRAYYSRSYTMTENTTSSFAADVLISDDKPVWFRTRGKAKQSKPPKFPRNEDIELWLKHNAPITFQQLADIRYSLYHCCSRADFTIAKAGDDQFDLTGRRSTLRVINDEARHYLLWRLRLLGRKRKWISALPRTKKPRKGP
jgi:hypothetical protein